MKKLFDWLIKPFREEFWFLFIVWMLSAIPALISGIKIDNLFRAANFCCKALVVSYLIVLFCSLFKDKISKALKIILIPLLFANLVLDTGMFEIYKTHLLDETVDILLGTNVEEAQGFLETYLTSGTVLTILTSLLAVPVFIFRRKITLLAEKAWPFFALVFICSIPVSLYHRPGKDVADIAGWRSVSLLKVTMFAQYKEAPDFHYQDPAPRVVCDGDGPENVIIVLGESLSRSHCSLYGYEKQTQPMLESLARQDSLVVFEDVTSAWYHTIQSFILMLTEGDNKENVYNNYTVFDYLKAAGYNSYWITNQAATGIYDNFVAKLSALSDRRNFVCGGSKFGYDDALIPAFKEYLHNPIGKRNVFFLHMKGQHIPYNIASPESFRHFNVSDYPDFSEAQRVTLCDYDNSVLFNDSVVAGIIDVVSSGESILFYVPDHAQDIYDSDPDYYGHARAGDEKSVEAGRSIPFVVYCSSKYIEKFPDEYKTILDMKSQPFNTENFIPMLLRILKIETS
ncbi:MAG: sulfatase-like hydrolase/transferase [Bacteroidales bacterium]|nr:sulfatase-like hydrolase/transferase [Bacteroidales bacterium]